MGLRRRGVFLGSGGREGDGAGAGEGAGGGGRDRPAGCFCAVGDSQSPGSSRRPGDRRDMPGSFGAAAGRKRGPALVGTTARPASGLGDRVRRQASSSLSHQPTRPGDAGTDEGNSPRRCMRQIVDRLKLTWSLTRRQSRSRSPGPPPWTITPLTRNVTADRRNGDRPPRPGPGSTGARPRPRRRDSASASLTAHVSARN